MISGMTNKLFILSPCNKSRVSIDTIAFREIKVKTMASNELLMLVVLLIPGILLSVLIMVTFAEGG